jgi:hypothetical protein
MRLLCPSNYFLGDSNISYSTLSSFRGCFGFSSLSLALDLNWIPRDNFFLLWLWREIYFISASFYTFWRLTTIHLGFS